MIAYSESDITSVLPFDEVICVYPLPLAEACGFILLHQNEAGYHRHGHLQTGLHLLLGTERGPPHPQRAELLPNKRLSRYKLQYL
ncbi:hypothetical protein [Verminephrobacter eiseniae]|uniref:hypothetical protein n=1 Tax=Verminephrobacter eiseniae TaxID=364317 RepID=UPI00223860E3|nr:hypothetical protein [Verminephrobacter eiseniae]